jgi:long-chain acyl-CoA synthetase
MLLFTSGTTGNARGVMLSHRNIATNIMDICKIVKVYPKDRALSILPIHHTFESTVGIGTVLFSGASTAFYEGLKYVSKNFKEAKASVLVAVPLIVESMYRKILKEAARTKRTKVLNFGIKLNKTFEAMGVDLKKRIFSSVYKQFGGNLRMVVSGAAAVDPKVIRGFEDLGIKMLQGYGLTECSPLVSGTPDFENTYKKAGSVGTVVSSGDLRIIDKDKEGIGEIIYKGPSVMLGYYKDEEATNEAIQDGWFHTGDLGFMDGSGWLYITGRKKNVIVTKTGKNIYPEEIEAYFQNSKYIGEILIYGTQDGDAPDADTIVAAQIRPNMEVINKELGDDVEDEAVYDLIKKTVSGMNMELPNYKRIRNMAVRKEEFEKTTTKKIKRHKNI